MFTDCAKVRERNKKDLMFSAFFFFLDPKFFGCDHPLLQNVMICLSRIELYFLQLHFSHLFVVLFLLLF